MARNKSIQVACEPKMYDKVSAYRKENKLSSDAGAMRELALIGIRHLEGEPESGKQSDRELLELILFHVTENDSELVVCLD